MQNNIGEARRSYGLTCENGKFTQEDAAAFFGVSVSTYQKWEQGTGKTLNLGQLGKMADKYGTSIDYLLCRTNDPTFERVRVLDRREQGILDAFRRCDEDGKLAIEASVYGIAARFDKKDIEVLEDKTA